MRAHPRSRGENELATYSPPLTRGSSPLTRGKHLVRIHRQQGIGLIPAHAGKTQVRLLHRPARRAHPRSRGENGHNMGLVWGPGGSSPLTRGKHGLTDGLKDRERLIPAHAGKTATSSACTGTLWAHPRSRGENGAGRGESRRCAGSSPLTRGKRRRQSRRRLAAGLIPAHAGKTESSTPRSTRSWAHPRSRGENHYEYAKPENVKGSSPLTRGKRCTPPPSGAHGSSPLTRGKPCVLQRRLYPRGLIPAHAGKTRRSLSTAKTARAHPRSRGENMGPNLAKAWIKGSSPLTRGKRA